MKKFAIGVAILFSLLALVFVLMPGIEYPKPNGKYAIGVTKFELERGKHWVQVTAWYPALPGATGTPMKYSDEWLAKALAKQQGLPEILMENPLDSASLMDVPIAPDKFPVLLFNHGYGAFPRANMTNMEALASQGYIVLSVGHPSESLILKRLNGDLVPLDESKPSQQASKKLSSDPALGAESWKKGVREMGTSKTMEEFHVALTEYENGELEKPFKHAFYEWFENNRLVLDQLPALQAGRINSVLKGAMDLDKIGAFGHSFGGAVTGELVLRDSRVKAGFNLDGPQYRYSSEPLWLEKPFCYSYSTDTLFGEEKVSFAGMNDLLLKTSSAWGCSVTIPGSTHMNFTDFNFVTPMKYFGLLGPIDSMKMADGLNQLLIQFFDWHLKGIKNWQPTDSDFVIKTFNDTP